MPLAVQDLTKRYGDKLVLSRLTHVFPEKGAAMIGGPSGCGKTTLLRILMGLETADSGTVLLPEGAKIAAAFQEDRLISHYTPRQNIALVTSCPQEAVEDSLLSLGLLAEADTPVDTFSGGMRRRVALARAVLTRPDILFLDEPFAGLDDAMRREASALILRSMQNGLILVVTHDEEDAQLLHCTDRLLLQTEKE